MRPFPLATVNELRADSSGVYVLEGSSISYTEGDAAEEYIRRILQHSSDLSTGSIELERAVKDWSSEYHLTAARANLLRCLDFAGIETVLELGCGCGAVTRYLGEQGVLVDSVEGGAVRAELARLRCRDLDNVQVVRANFNDLDLPEKSYDAVVMIGVLEYARMFSPEGEDDGSSISRILTRLRSSLKPGGVAVFALENRMGLKYLYGANEDHLSTPYLGVYDYPGNAGVHTYCEHELRQVLRSGGWEYLTFLYPFPDYKIPRVILGDEFVRESAYAHSLLYRIEARDYTSDWQSPAQEFLSWKGVHKAGLLGQLANSFLVVASNDKAGLERFAPFDFAHFSGVGRAPRYRTVTRKRRGSDSVEKDSLHAPGSDAAALDQELSAAPYLAGELLATSWLEALFQQNPAAAFSSCLEEYHAFLKEVFHFQGESGAHLELLPSNIIVEEGTGSWHPFDQEYKFPLPLTVEYVVFRALFWFAVHNKALIADAPGLGNGCATVDDFITLCFARLGKTYHDSRESFIRLEERFHGWVAAQMDRRIDVSYMLAGRLGGQPGVPENTAEGRPAGGNAGEKRGVMKTLALAKRVVKFCKSYFFNGQCRQIRRSGLFDEAYYRSKDAALQELSVDPLLHFVETGFREGRDPSPLFSTEYYCSQFPELEGGKENPLIHYLNVGWKKCSPTHPLLQDYILEPGTWRRNCQLVKKKRTAGERPHPSYFDERFYCRRYPDVLPDDEAMPPVVHYLRHGWKQRRQPGPFFDPEWYIDRTPFYGSENVDLLDHYLKTGVKTGKSPVPVFDLEYYKETSPATEIAEGKVFTHFLEKGLEEERRPCAWFDPVFYRNRVDRLDPYDFPFVHYLYEGVHQGVYVNEQVANLPVKPVVSIVLPVYNVKREYLNCCIRSILYQSYPHWQLCIVDDASSEPHIVPALRKWEEKDERISVKILERNRGIAEASNAGAAMATGEFLAFVDNDDELDPQALFHLVESINARGADLLYGDEDLIGDDGSRLSVFHKPDFNLELLWNHNYITHPVACRRRLFETVGGFTPGLSGAQDYDLFLKMSEHATSIVHIPRVLYHWRASETSTSINHTQKDYADHAGKKALEAMVERRGLKARVDFGEWKYFYRVKREIAGEAKVSVVVLGGEDVEVRRCLEHAAASTGYRNTEWISCCSQDSAEFARLQSSLGRGNVSCLDPGEGGYAAGLCARAVATASGEYLVFLNAAVRITNRDWLEALLEHCQDPANGLVSGRLERDAVEEEYTIPDIGNPSARYYARFIQNCSRHLNGLNCSQHVLMNPLDLTMISRRALGQAGGFAGAKCKNLFLACDMSLRLVALGVKNVYTPYALGSLTGAGIFFPGGGDLEQAGEMKHFQECWQEILVKGDPFYNTAVIRQAGISEDAFRAWYAGAEEAKK